MKMAVILWQALCDFIQGMKACLTGIIQIFEIEKQQRQQEAMKEQVKSVSTGPLSRRREQKGCVVTLPSRQQSLIHQLGQCCLWNGGLTVGMMLLFQYAFLPLMIYISSYFFQDENEHSQLWSWFRNFLNSLFQICWVFPIFTIGRFVNVIWFSQIANLAWKHSSKRSTNSLTIGLLVADLSFSVVMQLVFLVQCTLVGYLPLPFVAKKLSFAMVSLLYALYAFEYKWMNQGYSINVRLAKVENQWPYFMGFGLPLAYLTSLSGNYFIDGSLFAVLFPLTIISAHQAQTLQQNFVFPLRLFGLSMVLSNHLFQGHEFIIKVGKFIFSLILSIATTTTFIVKNTVGRFLT